MTRTLPGSHDHRHHAQSAASTAAGFSASPKSFIWRSACSLSQALIPMMISSMVPVVPKKTRGASDFRLIPTGIASNAPATENTHVPNALHFFFFTIDSKLITSPFSFRQ